MGASSANAIRASGHTCLHNRPDIRLQPCLLKRHTHEFLQSGRRPYKTFLRWVAAVGAKGCSLALDVSFFAGSGERHTANAVWHAILVLRAMSLEPARFARSGKPARSREHTGCMNAARQWQRGLVQ